MRIKANKVYSWKLKLSTCIENIFDILIINNTFFNKIFILLDILSNLLGISNKMLFKKLETNYKDETILIA